MSSKAAAIRAILNADTATAGEKQAARAALERLGLSVEDERREEQTDQCFTCNNEHEIELLGQVLCRYDNTGGDSFSYWRAKGNPKKILVLLTESEYELVSLVYGFYVRQWREKLKLIKEAAFYAFLDEADLFAPASDKSKRPTKDEIETAVMASQMNLGVERYSNGLALPSTALPGA